jgi:ubiquinone/menaquinone biosynthesis C-methylase UbiE
LSHTAATQPQAALAFDYLAKEYDTIFTKSLIGRAQRNAVWSVLTRTFRRGDRILELNCGTGEDAFFLARNGISIFACDASERMIQVADQRLRDEAPTAAVQFCHLPTERLTELQPTHVFDGAFSNFSGLNCVADLGQTSRDLSTLLLPGSPLLVCISTRFCFSEIVWFLLRGQFQKAFRRCSGRTTVNVGGFNVSVYYPTVRELKKLFSPSFTLRSSTGIGITVPPSYVEGWMLRYPRMLNLFRKIDGHICTWPGLRVLGDHVLLQFERIRA